GVEGQEGGRDELPGENGEPGQVRGIARQGLAGTGAVHADRRAGRKGDLPQEREHRPAGGPAGNRRAPGPDLLRGHPSSRGETDMFTAILPVVLLTAPGADPALEPWASKGQPGDVARRHVEKIGTAEHKYTVVHGGTMDGTNCRSPMGCGMNREG